MKAKIRHMIHGHGKHEAVERYIIIGLMLGVLIAGIGIGTSPLSETGAPAAMAMVGSFITFVFSVILVFYWVFRGDK